MRVYKLVDFRGAPRRKRNHEHPKPQFRVLRRRATSEAK
jgi:hypothetical protein